MQVRDIENFPAELQTLALPRQNPPLGERHIQASIAVSANYISRSTLSRKGMSEVAERCCRIAKHANVTADRVFKMTDLRPGHHVRDTLLIPVRRPEVAVINCEWEAAGPSSEAGKLPA